jgi:hypothetical protein
MVSFIFKKWAMVSFIWPFPIFLQKFGKKWPKMARKNGQKPTFFKKWPPPQTQ